MGKEQRDTLMYHQSICALTTKEARKNNLHGLSLLFCVVVGVCFPSFMSPLMRARSSKSLGPPKSAALVRSSPGRNPIKRELEGYFKVMQCSDLRAPQAMGSST